MGNCDSDSTYIQTVYIPRINVHMSSNLLWLIILSGADMFASSWLIFPQLRLTVYCSSCENFNTLHSPSRYGCITKEIIQGAHGKAEGTIIIFCKSNTMFSSPFLHQIFWKFSNTTFCRSWHLYSGSKNCPNVCLLYKDTCITQCWHNIKSD